MSLQHTQLRNNVAKELSSINTRIENAAQDTRNLVFSLLQGLNSLHELVSNNSDVFDQDDINDVNNAKQLLSSKIQELANELTNLTNSQSE